jgi:hypothetical protein
VDESAAPRRTALKFNGNSGDIAEREAGGYHFKPFDESRKSG